jgi:hypothetical protein
MERSLPIVASTNSFQLVYADERSTLAHMSGLAEMVKTRGGLQSIEFVTLREMLTR